MKSQNASTVFAEINAGSSPKASVLALFVMALAISGCQQLPSNHWSRPCGQRTGTDCYGDAVAPPLPGR